MRQPDRGSRKIRRVTRLRTRAYRAIDRRPTSWWAFLSEQSLFVLEEENRQLYDKIQERNLARQYDLLVNCIEIGLLQGIRSFDNYCLWCLNAAAVANISQHGGRFRLEPIYLKGHTPPHFKEVPSLMDQFISTVQENWYIWDVYVLASYVLWRPNWIHPFIEGNGRTARAACYYILCVKSGGLIGGQVTVPERIRHDRTPYYDALKEADLAWQDGRLEFPKMEAYLARLVDEQVMDMPVDEHAGDNLGRRSD